MARTRGTQMPLRTRLARLALIGAAGGGSLLLAQRLFRTPAGAIPDAEGPSVYINTYLPGQSIPNTILYYGAKHSVSAARATKYAEVRTPAGIADAIRQAAAEAGEPLRRITIASHGTPGGLILDRTRQDEPEERWLLTTDLLLDWMAADLRDVVSRDATIVFESCDTSPIVAGAPAAQSRAFRAAVAATFDVPANHIVLFRGPAKYAWGFDGFVPRTRPLEIVFDRDAPEERPT